MATERADGLRDPSSFIPNVEARREMALKVDISGARNDPSMRNMVALINILIDDVRKQNDRAPIRAIMRNQGRIAAFQELLDIITRDYPSLKSI